MSTSAFRISAQQTALLSATGGPGTCTQVVAPASGARPHAVHAALVAAVQRNEVLRTSFETPAGMRLPLQTVRDAPIVEWREVVDADPVKVAEEDLLRPFDRELGPCWRATFVGGASAHLVITALALVLDRPSVLLLAREVLGEHPLDPADEPLQYADYSAWQQETLDEQTAVAGAGRRWWQSAPAALPTEALPFAGAPTGATGRCEVRVPTSAAVAGAAASLGVTPGIVLTAAWHALLHRTTGLDDLTVAWQLDGRDHDELVGAIGAFARRAPVSTHVDADPTFAELVDQVRRAHDEARRHGDWWGGWVAPTGVGAALLDVPGAWSSGPSDVALELVVRAGDGGGAELVHDLGVLSCDQAARWSERLAVLAAAAVAQPGLTVSRLPFTPDAERDLVIAEWNQTRRATPDGTVADWIATAALRSGGDVAVRDDARALTYSQLDAQANQLAHHLIGLGVQPGAVVGLCTDRSAAMVVGLLGIWRAGAAYLPLNLDHPPARLAHQLTESAATVVVAQDAVSDRLPPSSVLVRLDADQAVLGSHPTAAPAARPPDAGLAYVLYTSGSTGLPKGVAVSHANLANYTSYLVERLGAGEASDQQWSFAVMSALSTDLGNTALFPGLVSGGRLELVSPEVAMDPALFAGFIAERPVDVMKITPSHLGALLAGVDAPVLPRRVLVLGGEVSTWDLVARVRAAGTCRIVNHYGPTETTVGSCTFDLTEDVDAWRPATVPVGHPIANTLVYVLDRHLAPVPVGVAGEVCIAGDGVAQGYVGQPGQTAERFVADPFHPAERMYRTGDLARHLPNGALEFLGRIDQQVKIRGFRIEPAEIEAALERRPDVRQAVVVARADAIGGQRLVAYLVASGDPSVEDLRAGLAGQLPDYMVPSVFALIDSLPMTPSGKIDRKALPGPEQVARRRSTTLVAPRTPTEVVVAEVWSEVLGVAEIGVHDDFFAIGGHSLMATQVVARLRSAFAIDLPLHSLFTAPTVAGLSEVVAVLVPGLVDAEDDDAEVAALLASLEGLSEAEAAALFDEA